LLRRKHWRNKQRFERSPFEPPGPALRFSIGLEDPDDLKADLEAGFERLNAAR